MIYHFGYLEQFHSTLSHYIQRMRILFNSQKNRLGSMKHRHFRLKACLFFFGFHHLFNLVWGGQFWYQVVPAPSRSQLQGIEPWNSLPNSAPITTELTDDWYWKHVLRHNTNAYSITSILSNYYQSHVRCSCVCLCQCCIDYDSHAKS
jgi:hypothetical protein